ncbi:unnamed protein product (macronuclear) [Paramecium tetraurelia]|uniref:Cyclic nucleotide-binding domain-containing protein n=1 Tax=Paramecium tetraurelia TaxID=5888 RepID=A0CSV4_PARTE|nr:uncharacterized protein GSPATT00010143001 [Paramecium tetraurelia]CAK73871.1 unnamed protein product [Paramecium tetraurelia]|eukprot:XP_001441268.1 hypothetical protein (macronuclear) [Paramecium tetraurelia strain d4-2]
MQNQLRFRRKCKSMRNLNQESIIDQINSPRDQEISLFEFKRFCVLLQKQRQKDKALKQQQKREHLRNLMAKKFRLIYNVIRLLHHHERVILERHDEGLKKKSAFLIFPVSYEFNQGDPSRRIWDIILLITYIQTAIYLPLRIAFMDKGSSGVYQLDLINDIIYCIEYQSIYIVTDMLCILRSCYYNRQNVLVQNQWFIFLNYLKGWLIPDIITLIPLDSIYKQLVVKQLVYMFNIINSQDSLEYLESTVYSKCPLFIKKKIFVTSNWENVFNIFNSYQLNIIKIIVKFIYGLHLFSCLWYLASNINDNQYETDQDYKGLLNQNSEYIGCLFWALQTFSTIGYGNDAAKNYAQYIVAILWMFLGASFYCVILLNLSEWLKKLNSECVYVEMQNTLKLFFKKIDVIKEVQTKIQLYLALNIKQNQAWSLSLQEWFQNLPTIRQKEITLYVSYIEIMQIHFFRLNLNFSVSILPKMMLMKTQQNCKIWIKDEVVNEIYFLIRGKLQYRTQFGKVLLQINEGSVFGEQEYFKKLMLSKQHTRKNYAVAIELCEYIILNGDYFFQQMSSFPALRQYLAIIAHNREQRMKAQIIYNRFEREREIMNTLKLEKIKETCNIDVTRYEGMIKPQKSIIYDTQHSRTQQILEQLIHNRRNKIDKLMQQFKKVVQMIIFANKLIEKQSFNVSKVHPLMIFQQQQQTQTTLKTQSNESRVFISQQQQQFINQNYQNQNTKKIEKSIIIKMKQFSNASYRKRKQQISKKIWIHNQCKKYVLQQMFRVKYSRHQIQNTYSFQDYVIEVDDFSHYERQLKIFRTNFQDLKKMKKQLKQNKELLKIQIDDFEKELLNVYTQIEKLELKA